jgi:hypothetical protein
MTLTARIIRIRSDRLRVALLAVVFVPEMARFACWLVWNAPQRFFLTDPWVFSWSMWRMAAAGEFVDSEVQP